MDTGEALACLSVRSGFDLTLAALDLRAGDEVVMSALNIPHMADIVVAHGGVPVPVDLDSETMAPDPERLAEALTARTRAMVVAHLFGGRVDLGAAAELAAQRGVPLLEDCAQAFDGQRFRGDPRATVSLFSFGVIKTATALGGALLVVRDPSMLRRMRAMRDGQPAIANRAFLGKVLKYAALKPLSHPRAYGLLVATLGALGLDVDGTLNHLTRSFRGTDLLGAIRRQPSVAQLALLRLRLQGDAAAVCDARRRLGETLGQRLPENLALLGRGAAAHTHWLFPIVAPDPRGLIAHLAEAGIDATQARDTLALVPPPEDRPHLRASAMSRVMPGVVYLPVDPGLRDTDVERLVAALQAAASETASAPRGEPTW